MTSITGWLGLGCCLWLLLAAADRGACHEGFGGGTTVTLTLDQTSVYRDAWEAAYGRFMGGAITVSQHGTTDSNDVRLDGHREGTLLQYENYWSMTTYTMHFTSSQTTARYNFDFGPPCAQPDDLLSWNQYYKYTATIFAGNHYVTDSTTLTVINEWGSGMSIIEETL